MTSLRDLYGTVKDRIHFFQDNPEELGVLKDDMSGAQLKIDICSESSNSFCKAVLTEFKQTFELIDLKGVLKTMTRVKESVDELEKRLQRGRGFFKKVMRAKRVARDIAKQVNIIREIFSTLHDMNERIKEISQIINIFSPDFSTITGIKSSWC